MKIFAATSALLAAGVIGSAIVQTASEAATTRPVVNIGNVPLPVTVGNGAANPVPVRITASPSAAVVECSMPIGASVTGVEEFISTISSVLQSNVVCRGGATKVDVQKMLVSLHETTPGLSDNVASFNVRVGFADGSTGIQILAVLTDAAPQAEIAIPFRLDRSAGGSIVADALASSGIPGVFPKFSARLFLIGTVVE